MSDDIKVTVVKFPDRDNLMLRYFDPMTGKPKHKTSGTTNRKDAVKEAGKWEAELREGRYQAPLKTTWATFRDRYEDEVLASLAKKTDAKLSGIFNSIEEHINPQKLSDLTPAHLSHYQAKLRENRRRRGDNQGQSGRAQGRAWLGGACGDAGEGPGNRNAAGAQKSKKL